MKTVILSRGDFKNEYGTFADTATLSWSDLLEELGVVDCRSKADTIESVEIVVASAKEVN